MHNVAVMGYNMYQNDVIKATSLDTNFSVSDLEGGTSYDFSVSAIDESGNESARSAILMLKQLKPLAIVLEY